MQSIYKFNSLDGKMNVTRATLEKLLKLAEKERVNLVQTRVVKILKAYPNNTHFDIVLQSLVKPFGLNGARHTGFGKIGLDECGRLQPGFIFDGAGNVVPAIGQTKTRPARKCNTSCKEDAPAPKKTTNAPSPKKPSNKTTKSVVKNKKVDAPAPTKRKATTDYGKKRKRVKVEKAVEKELFSKDDIPYNIAFEAHRGTSFDPEKRAVQIQNSYVKDMTEVYAENLERAKKLNLENELNTRFLRFKAGYLTKYLAYLRSRHGIYSTMIAGGSNFPVARMNKKNEVSNKRNNEFIEYFNKFQNFYHNETKPVVIKTGSATALDQLKEKLTKEENQHQRTLDFNKIMRKKISNDDKRKELLKVGFTEEFVNKIEKDQFFELGRYVSTNSNARIAELKRRISTEEKLNEKAEQGNKKITFEGGEIIDNFEVNRIQVFFDSKPDEKTRTFLKKGGQAFKWSPSNGVWQRQLNTYWHLNRKDLYEFLGVDVKPTPPTNDNNGNEKKNTSVKTADVFNYPVAQIFTDTKRFQNRSKLNETVLKQIVDNYNIDKLDPVLIWKDPKAKKSFLLAGHHRLEATKLKGLKTIQAKYFKGTETEAIHYAKVESNANRSLELPQERAKIYRELHGKIAKAKILEDARKLEGKNASYIVNLSYLQPNGITIAALEQLDGADKQNATLIEKIADWIGDARRNNDDLTNAHEKEMFNFLMDKTASERITNKTDFLHKISAITNGLYFDKNEVLNLKRFKNKTEGESVYDAEYNELKSRIETIINNKQSLLDRMKNPSNKDFIKPTDKDYNSIVKALHNAIDKYDNDLKVTQRKLIELSQKKGSYTNAGSNQVGLFGAKKKGLKQPEINVNSLAYKQQNKANVNHEYYIVPDKQIANFLGKIEKKQKESVAITITGGQGSMKTRFCFQLMNCFGKNYKVGHASIEEHPDSALYEDKIKQYLDKDVLHNISSPEIETLDDIHKLVRENDVIIIDSFSKLQEMNNKIGLDKDFRKAYNGKLFVIIYQQTTDGKMRGGSKSQFDGDVILQIEKQPDYKNNFVFANKNRYQRNNLDDLKFNIFSKKLQTNNENETTKLSFSVK